MPDTATIFSVEAAGLVYKRAHYFVYLGGNVDHDADLSITSTRVLRRVRGGEETRFRNLFRASRVATRTVYWRTAMLYVQIMAPPSETVDKELTKYAHGQQDARVSALFLSCARILREKRSKESGGGKHLIKENRKILPHAF